MGDYFGLGTAVILISGAFGAVNFDAILLSYN
jgi:hypothetical protein